MQIGESQYAKLLRAGIVEDLGYRKVCAKLAPLRLTPALKYSRVEVFSKLLFMFEADEQNFFQILQLKIRLGYISTTPRPRVSDIVATQ